ncbi:hypothetical protein V5799_017612 [Amblyomma americanum]|uniref:Uncharacterized protein n=1 Tax=Amblyomma americanum TaxID=6943 RepID=A0AAQ4F1S4_AMBAM
MVIFPDRTQGGTSLQEGHLELMVHRQHSTNDELGLPEALKETGIDNEGIVARGTHRVFLGSPQDAASLIRLQALQLVYKPVLLFAPAEWEPIKETFTALKSSLPITVHVLTLERVSSSHVLLRLEHLGLQKGSVTVNVTLRRLRSQTGAYTNDTVAFLSGCDLCYVNAHCRFQKQEAFMAEANRLSQKGIRYPPVHVVQSTPACYIEAVPLAPHRHGIPESLGLAKSSLVFQANVEPLGASLYYVKSTQGESSKSADFLEIHEEVNFIENEVTSKCTKYRVELDADTGLVSRIVLRQTQTPVELHQSFAAYGFNRYPEGNMSPPGHYVFSAYTPAREMGEQVTYRVVKHDPAKPSGWVREVRTLSQVHRRHETNDNLGLPDPLLEMGVDDGGLVARGTHRLFLGSPMEARGLMRLQALQLVYQPLPVFALANWKPKLDKIQQMLCLNQNLSSSNTFTAIIVRK